MDIKEEIKDIIYDYFHETYNCSVSHNSYEFELIDDGAIEHCTQAIMDIIAPLKPE